MLAWRTALLHALGVLALGAGSVAAPPCRADTVASLLGNFTVNQYAGLRLAPGTASVRYTVVFGQLPALRELHLADANGDGVTSQDERDAYARALAPRLAAGLRLTVDGATVPLHATHWATSLPTEQGGFSLRVDVDYAGDVPAASGAVQHAQFSNGNYPGRFGWQEVVVTPAGDVAIFDTNAFGSSLTADLTEALAALPAAGPLAEREVHLGFRRGAPPAGSAPLAARNGVPLAAASTSAATPQAAAWLTRQTRRLVDMISGPAVPARVMLLALLAAIALGALHAFSPGHGKTVVGAYLVGSRGTPRHALFLGVTVTVTHTIGVFALGFATLLASEVFRPEQVFPVLTLASALLVLGMGVTLVARRWPHARAVLLAAPRPAYRVLQPAAALAGSPGAHARTGAWWVGPRHAGAAHAGAHVHAHFHGGLVHAHGGRLHSHLPPGASGEAVTWRSLLALGVSGGLVPCPSAMVLLLAAVAMHKTAYGLLLVLAFSVGLAATLAGVGVAFLHARQRVTRAASAWRFAPLLPVASAGVIAVLGAAMCVGAIVTLGR